MAWKYNRHQTPRATSSELISLSARSLCIDTNTRPFVCVAEFYCCRLQATFPRLVWMQGTDAYGEISVDARFPSSVRLAWMQGPNPISMDARSPSSICPAPMVCVSYPCSLPPVSVLPPWLYPLPLLVYPLHLSP